MAYVLQTNQMMTKRPRQAGLTTSRGNETDVTKTTDIIGCRLAAAEIRTKSELEAGWLDGIGHVGREVELLVAGRRSDVAILLLLRAEVLLYDLERLLVDIVVLVVLQEFDLVKSCARRTPNSTFYRSLTCVRSSLAPLPRPQVDFGDILACVRQISLLSLFLCRSICLEFCSRTFAGTWSDI